MHMSIVTYVTSPAETLFYNLTPLPIQASFLFTQSLIHSSTCLLAVSYTKPCGHSFSFHLPKIREIYG